MMPLRTLFLAVVGWGLVSCRGALGPGLAALEEGRLPAAGAELRRLEPEVAGWDDRARARYALYRGLVELGLGNASLADRWLFTAWRADGADPTLLDEREHGELMAAWRSSGRLPGESGR
jgi:hypothetical protein